MSTRIPVEWVDDEEEEIELGGEDYVPLDFNDIAPVQRGYEPDPFLEEVLNAEDSCLEEPVAESEEELFDDELPYDVE